MGKQGQKIIDGAEQFLEPGERVVAGAIAQARGHTLVAAGGAGSMAAREIGLRKTGKQTDAAADAGLVVASPMGLVATDRRLLTLKISTPWGLGLGGNVKELLSAVPIGEVERAEIKRLGVGRVLTLTVRGVEFKLEAGAGADVQGIADAIGAQSGVPG
jgi:hypothetical protein